MFKSLLSLFLNSNCPLCERGTEDTLCKDCQRQVKSSQLKNPQQYWQGDPTSSRQEYVPLFAWGQYGGKLKQAIAAMKYNNHPEIGTFLGYWLGESWLKFSPVSTKKITVIPIPLHPQKLKERGFNQAESIAQGFCQVTGYPLMVKGLERVKNTEAMFGLNPTERKENINNAFKVGKNLQKSVAAPSVLILDDIYTTGTTVKEAVKILHLHGVQVLGVAALSTPIEEVKAGGRR